MKLCTMPLSIYIGKKKHSTTDAFAETNEDKYFSVLYELYYLAKK